MTSDILVLQIPIQVCVCNPVYKMKIKSQFIRLAKKLITDNNIYLYKNLKNIMRLDEYILTLNN